MSKPVTVTIHACGEGCPYYQALYSTLKFVCKKDHKTRLSIIREEDNFPDSCPLKDTTEPNLPTPIEQAFQVWRKADSSTCRQILRSYVDKDAVSYWRDKITLTFAEDEILRLRILKDVFRWYLKINHGTLLHTNKEEHTI